MKHSIFALPALLRPAFLLAVASQSTFNVFDDLLAFPQYEVNFSEDYVSEAQASARLNSDTPIPFVNGAASDIAQYRPTRDPLESHSTKTGDLKLSYETLVLDSQRYLCSVPVIEKPVTPPPLPHTNETLTRADKEKELARANDHGWELLSSMQGQCVYFISGWWSYRYCYNDEVRQFHQLPPGRGTPVFPPTEDPRVEGFTLGKHNEGELETPQKEVSSAPEIGTSSADTTLKTFALGELVQRGDSRYLVQRLGGGTKCDLTGKERRIEIQFHCNPLTTDRIALIKETSTCAYLMQIQTPRLCSDITFLPAKKPEPNHIQCSPILKSDEEIETYTSQLSLLKDAERDARIREATAEAAKIIDGDSSTAKEFPQGQLVGDIIVGGQHIVPADVTLEASSIVGGGKETYVATVASFDGKTRKTLAKADLDRLNLGSIEQIEKVLKQLETLAGDQKWKLDVVDTPRGREYRGVIGAGASDEKDEKSKKDDDSSEEGSKEEFYKEEL